MYLGLQV